MKVFLIFILGPASYLAFTQGFTQSNGQESNPSASSRYEKLRKEGLHDIMPAVDLKIDDSYQDQIGQQSSGLAKPPKLQDTSIPIQFSPSGPETTKNQEIEEAEIHERSELGGSEYQVPDEEFNQ